eukprot:265609_1
MADHKTQDNTSNRSRNSKRRNLSNGNMCMVLQCNQKTTGELCYINNDYCPWAPDHNHLWHIHRETETQTVQEYVMDLFKSFQTNMKYMVTGNKSIKNQDHDNVKSKRQ